MEEQKILKAAWGEAMSKSKDEPDSSPTHLRISGNDSVFTYLTVPTPPRHLTRDEIAALPEGSLPPQDTPLIDKSLSPKEAAALKKWLTATSTQLAEQMMRILDEAPKRTSAEEHFCRMIEASYGRYLKETKDDPPRSPEDFMKKECEEELP